jgi:ribonucleoside-diphosphate reductase alpha chain
MGLSVTKRDGRVVLYEIEKIEKSIRSAMNSMEMEVQDDILPMVEERVMALGEEVVDIEKIQDIIEESLMDLGYNSVAKAYIIYREKRKRQRELRESLEIVDDLKLGLNAAALLKDRYLMRDENRNVIETPSELFRRVARTVAVADRKYDKDADIEAVEELFYRSMINMEFLPNSPALFSAGNKNNTLAACFVLDIEDSLEDIFEKVKQTGLITKMGGGVGISFSNLRPKNDNVGSTGGISSGPVSFMKLFDTAIDVCKQGGVRRGALMGTLRVDHPDILEFIRCKQDRSRFTNFNISVLITDAFMDVYLNDETYDLINPRNGEVVESISARTVMDQIVYMAHSFGDPGLVFIDEINEKHPIRNLEIRGVNVCGEQPLAPYESCLLGAINLSKFVKDEKVNYKELKRVVGLVVHFLDNMLDVNIFPLKQIQEATEKTRKIGVGVMGWAEMLIQLNIPYESSEALELAEKVMSFIDREAHKFSRDLAVIRGNFPLFDDYKKRYSNMRNAVLTTAAPTGSRSIIADTSSGIEPLFAIAHTRVTGDGMRMLDINKFFVEKAKETGIWNEEMRVLVSKEGVLGKMEEISKELRNLFKTSHEISPEQHVLMQSAFQKHIGSSVSKTVNLRKNATLEDVKNVFIKAYEIGCKGITIFRDGCLDQQVLYLGCTTCDT